VFKNALKLILTVAVFVGLFFEFGGGPVAVDKASVLDGSAFTTPAAEKGAPPVPVAVADLCTTGASQKKIFVHTAAGADVPIKTLRHCEGDDFVLARATADGAMQPLSEIPGEQVYLLSKGFQLVEIDFVDLWREVTSVSPAVFVPWLLFAILVKLSGIMANIYRWKVLLDAQGVRLSFGWLNASYWVGRYWGIVTPSTMGLDGWRLYDTIRATRKPIECTTALAVERLVGFVSLLGAILIILPFADVGGENFQGVLKAVKFPLVGAVILGAFFLLQPSWFASLVRLVPHARAQKFLGDAIQSATAYSHQRSALVIAMGCAIFGQFTTMFMYLGNAYALGVEGVDVTKILAASAVMTFGTFLVPSASGEGVRELIFVELLAGHTTAAKAFLIGHLGFWIEKLPLSLPGGVIMMRAPESYKRITRDDLEAIKAETAAEQAGSATP
jgi:uncharacterized membrane protein YbhN (UPF0104 family)